MSFHLIYLSALSIFVADWHLLKHDLIAFESLVLDCCFPLFVLVMFLRVLIQFVLYTRGKINLTACLSLATNVRSWSWKVKF